MRARMQDRPLALNHIFHRAERLFAERRIVVANGDRDEVTTIGDWAQNVRRLAAALNSFGLSDDARVGTFSVNHRAHLEAYYAVPLTGRILHTINIRLSATHLRFIVNDAGDEALIVDRSLLSALWPLVGELPTVRVWVVVDDGSGAPLPDDPRIVDYAALLARTPPYVGRFEIDDENRAAGLCYTSGTTGNPRGVLYSHRSTVLHAMMLMTAGNLGINEADVVLPIVPMFHADAWGLPYATIFAGGTLVLPGRWTTPEHLVDLMARQGVTIAAAATTVWAMLAPVFHKASRPTNLRLAMTGASAASEALSEVAARRHGRADHPFLGHDRNLAHGSIGRVAPRRMRWRPRPTKSKIRGKQGRPVPLVELRVAGTDSEQPWDGQSQGELEVSGPFVTASYWGDTGASAFTEDGWLRTGDLGTIDEHGYVRIVDRLKDVIKSGGEWISSIELENAIMSHPDVAEAAVIGRPHEKWAERPVAAVVVRPGRALTADDIIAHLRPLVAKWWLPDEVIFVNSIPKTGTGKFSKLALRQLLNSRPT